MIAAPSCARLVCKDADYFRVVVFVITLDIDSHLDPAEQRVGGRLDLFAADKPDVTLRTGKLVPANGQELPGCPHHRNAVLR